MKIFEEISNFNIWSCYGHMIMAKLEGKVNDFIVIGPGTSTGAGFLILKTIKIQVIFEYG